MGDIDTMTDEVALHEMFRKTTDFAERKKIRMRLKQIREEAEAAYTKRMDANRQEAAADMRRRQAEAEKKRKMDQYEKEQALHEEHLAKGDSVEEFKAQQRAEADAEKQRKIDELSKVDSGAANVTATDIVAKSGL